MYMNKRRRKQADFRRRKITRRKSVYACMWSVSIGRGGREGGREGGTDSKEAQKQAKEGCDAFSLQKLTCVFLSLFVCLFFFLVGVFLRLLSSVVPFCNVIGLRSLFYLILILSTHTHTNHPSFTTDHGRGGRCRGGYCCFRRQTA